MVKHIKNSLKRMKKISYTIFLTLLLAGCGTCRIEGDNNLSAKEIPALNDIGNLSELLPRFDGAGPLQTRVYEGTLPTKENQKIFCRITLYNYQNSGDGIFQLRLIKQKAEGSETKTSEYIGRRYTLRGHEKNADAVVWQLVPFDKQKEIMNFEYRKDKLLLLSPTPERLYVENGVLMLK